MTARMPIAAALLGGRHICRLGDVFTAIEHGKTNPVDNRVMLRPIERETSDRLLRSLHASVKFDVQMASELYWGKPKEYYRIDKDFGPMRLPYPHVWLEWYMPHERYIQGRKRVDPLDEPPPLFAAHLTESDPIGDGTLSIICEIMAFMPVGSHQPPGLERPVLYNEVVIRIDLDDRGLFAGKLLEYRPTHHPADVCETLMLEAKSSTFVACMALNLINCRNVTTAKAGNVQFKRSGTDKRRGVQPVTYHTIVLPGMTVERGKVSKRQAAANAEALRLHRVRGHFKTFTPQAPLLGRHVGTYWWNPGVRGSAKRGVVHQDYKIGETADAQL